MVSHSIPMGYESLRTVLLHTDPNLRFKVAQRIPKIRLMEKAVPLKIKSLELNASETVINSQSYKLGVYRHYSTEGKKRFNKAGLQMMLMDAYRSALLPFNYRQNNLSPPYTCYIQLTITQEDATTIQEYEYNHKLNETLFANRHVIIVNHLQSAFFDVLRMPIGLKISAKVVSGDSRQLIPISSIVDSSKPLPELNINVTSESALTLQHSFVKNAEVLSIWTYKNIVNQLARALKTMENQRVHFKFCRFDNPSANEYYQLLQGWLAIERNVGSMITFELNADHIGESILELVRNQNEITESTDRCVTVPLRNATKLEAFYAPLHEDENVSRFFFEVRIEKS